MLATWTKAMILFMHLSTHTKEHSALIEQRPDFFYTHYASQSATQEEPVAIEAKVVNCFPFCNLRTSAGYSGENRPFCPPTLRQSSLPNDTSDALCLLLFLSSVYSVFTILSSARLYANVSALASGNGDPPLSKQRDPKLRVPGTIRKFPLSFVSLCEKQCSYCFSK